MNDGSALLASILANPDDDAPRLIYADWLDEHGEPERAEFIRVQCELAKRMGTIPDPNCPHPINSHCTTIGIYTCGDCYGALRRRERELLDKPIIVDERGRLQPRCLWAGKCILLHKWDFARGFVDAVTCTAADWLAHSDAILSQHPVREVRLTTWPVIGRRTYYGRPAIEEMLRAEWPSVKKWHLTTVSFQPHPEDYAHTRTPVSAQVGDFVREGPAGWVTCLDGEAQGIVVQPMTDNGRVLIRRVNRRLRQPAEPLPPG
jgi:uncharacterized protein (TIGR02996 family)